eukprot:CAMPEP_0119313148 /NCGR_PEP_ID=MMETSP1333-20130426/28047_1 /TAXON_ID=418940 /ORGANISM="Scyphosphaera apsteinii, Strain RCC1455" /LENGTH=164 /DNA_ID=CAMNT_0007317905 /DNA_START=18 /DNA_END=513 /DNA_ORIENTATION=+
MGARRCDEHTATVQAVTAPAVNPPDIDVEPLVLDNDELKALHIFHRSFNLPGLRLGLVNAVSKDDYFPPDEEDSAAQALVEQSHATTSLLQRANELLNADDVEEVVEPVEEESTAPVLSTHTSALLYLDLPGHHAAGQAAGQAAGLAAGPRGDCARCDLLALEH